MKISKKHPEILIICCDNGLGHIKRSLILGDKLIHENFKVHIVSFKNKFLKLVQILDISQNLKNINISLNYDEFGGGICSLKEKITSIPNIKNYDIVISDNLVDTLKIRPDSILLSNFFGMIS